MLIAAIAYDPSRNLGRAYNDVMRRLDDDDWACFIDHDAMFTTRDWYHQLTRVAELMPAVGLFTCVTNRIGNQEQIATGCPLSHDIIAHRIYGQVRADKYGYGYRSAQYPISGVMMMLSKRVWMMTGGFKNGFLGVDNAMHRSVRDIGKEVAILEGVYVYHWYRADGKGHPGAMAAR